MSEPKTPREYCVPVWGLFLLFLGILFLLQTFNVLPWGLWGTLWRFWPVLIISVGLSLLFRVIIIFPPILRPPQTELSLRWIATSVEFK